MEFRATQTFTAGIDEVLAAYTDPSLYLQLDGLSKIGRPNVLGRSEHGDLVTMFVHYTFVADLPSAALAVIDPTKLTWVDETIYDMAHGTSTTRLLPDHYAERLSASATATFETAQSEQPGCVRRISGQCTVRMPIVGGKVEQAIVEGLQEHLGDESGVVDRYLGA